MASLQNSENAPCLFSYIFICFLTIYFIWSEQILSPFLEKVAYLAAEARADEMWVEVVSYIELQMNKTGAKIEDAIKVRAVVGSLTEGAMKGRAYDIVEVVEHKNME